MGHGHDHGHHHHNNEDGSVKNIRMAFFLNLAFTIFEIFGGIFTNSVVILSDALHDLGDSLSLGLAWYFQKVSQKGADRKYSYGYKRFSVLGALINSVVLITGSIFIIMEAVRRLFEPEVANAKGMIFFAIFGIIVNGAAVFRLKKGTSLNERVIYLHLMEDVLGWVAVLIAGIVLLFVEIPWLDPALSLVITAYILYNVFHNLRKSLRIFLQATPKEMDLDELEEQILAVPGVNSLHKIRLWSLDGEYNILTIHLVIQDETTVKERSTIRKSVRKLLKEKPVHDITIEIEMESQRCD